MNIQQFLISAHPEVKVHFPCSAMLPRRRSKCRFSVSESQPVKGAAACAGGVCVCSDRRLSFQREQLTSFELGRRGSLFWMILSSCNTDEVIDVVACWRGVDCHIAAADRCELFTAHLP